MAWSATVVGSASLGNLRKIWGTYTMAAGDTGGTIATGLGGISDFAINQTDTVSGRDSSRIVSQSSGTLTLTLGTGASGAETGHWYAIGK